MTQDLRVALTTSLNDRLVAPLQRTLDAVERSLKTVQRDLDGVKRSGDQAASTLANMRGPQQATAEAARLARETERAAGLAQRLQAAWSAAGNVIRGATAAMAAGAAVRAVVGPQLQQARGYEWNLANLANTAYAGKSLDEKRAGMAGMDQAVRAAVMDGGGTRDSAIAAMNRLVGSGTVDVGTAGRLLTSVQKTATASGATSEEVADIIVRALQNGFKEADIPQLLDQAMAAGQAGGFELKDMAKWLPQIQAIASQTGMRGPRDMPMLLAAMQTSLITAGSRDQAGNNLVNLLNKINSRDTAVDAQKMGIDLSGTLAAARDKGVNSLGAFVNLTQQIADKDPRLAKLRKEYGAAGSDEERKANLQSQMAILQGSSVGKLIQDQQALMALVALLNNPQYLNTVLNQITSGGGATGSAHDLLKTTSEYQINRAEQAKLFAQSDALGPANAALARLSTVSADLYSRYPGFAAALEATKIAVAGLGAAAAAAGGALLLTGGAKGALAGAGAAAGGLVARLGGAAAAAGGAVASTAGLAVAGAGAAGAAAGYGLYAATAGTGFGDAIGKLAATVMAGLGSKEAEAALAKMAEYDGRRAAEHAQAVARMEALAQRPIVIQVDSGELVRVVQDRQGADARRR